MNICRKKYIVYGNGEIGKKYINNHIDDFIECILDKKIIDNTIEKYMGLPIYNPEYYLHVTWYNDKKDLFIVIAVDDWAPIAIYLENNGLNFYKNFIPYTLVSNESKYLDWRIFNLRTFDERILSEITENRKIVMCYGECHMHYYKEYLSRNESFSSEYIIVNIPDVQEMKRGEKYSKLSYDNLWCYADVLLCNDIQDAIANEWGVNSISKLQELLSGKCKVIIITSATFKGYFPQAIRVKDANITYYCGWGNKFFNKMFKNGYSLDKIIRKLEDEDMLSEKMVLDFIKSSIKNLEYSEENCNVKIADYISLNYSRKVLYYSPTHAIDDVMRKIAERILMVFGIQVGDYHPIINFRYDRNETPIYPSVAKAIGLPLDVYFKRKLTPGHYYNDREKITNDEYHKMYYNLIKEYK